MRDAAGRRGAKKWACAFWPGVHRCPKKSGFTLVLYINGNGKTKVLRSTKNTQKEEKLVENIAETSIQQFNKVKKLVPCNFPKLIGGGGKCTVACQRQQGKSKDKYSKN